jgi:hypothetical protein
MRRIGRMTIQRGLGSRSCAGESQHERRHIVSIRLQVCDNLIAAGPKATQLPQAGRMAAIDPRRHLVRLRRPRPCLRCREREPGRLQLRVIARLGEGVCDVIVEESDTRVEVLILICGQVEDSDEVIDSPFHVYLARPLGKPASSRRLARRRHRTAIHPDL